MNWRKFFSRKRSDAELQEEIRTLSRRRDCRKRRSRDTVCRSPAPSSDQTRRSPARSRGGLATEHRQGDRQLLARSEIRHQNLEADASIYHDSDSRDGAGHWRECCALHGCTQRPARSFAFPSSKPTHRFISKVRYRQGRYGCGRGFLRLAKRVPQLRANGHLATDRLQHGWRPE